GMFGHVGYAAYNAALDATRLDLAAALGDPTGAPRISLAQSASDGLNTLVAGLAIPERSLILTTAEEHGSALYPLRRRAELGDRHLTLFTPTRLGWRSRLELPTGSKDYNPNATRFETGTVDAGAFVGLRQTLLVHRLLGSWVGERVRTLRARLIDRMRELPFAIRSTPDMPTGIVVVEPRSGGVSDLVTRMWDEERMVVKLIDEPG